MNHFNQRPWTAAVAGTVLNVGGTPSETSCRFSLVDIGNNNAAPSFLQVFNLAAADVTLGATAPILTFEIPANSGRTIPLGSIINFGGSGFSVAGTTGRANATGPST